MCTNKLYKCYMKPSFLTDLFDGGNQDVRVKSYSQYDAYSSKDNVFK